MTAIVTRVKENRKEEKEKKPMKMLVFKKKLN